MLYASHNSNDGGLTVWSEKGFPISGVLSREDDDFPGTIIYYYEVTKVAISENWTRNRAKMIRYLILFGFCGCRLGYSPTSGWVRGGANC
jgi:hypothetical protein